MNLFIPYWLAAGIAYLVLALVIGWAFVALVNLSWYFIAEALRKAKLWWPFVLFIADKVGRKKWQDIAEVERELQKARGEAGDNWHKAYGFRGKLQRIVWNLPEETPDGDGWSEFRKAVAEAEALLKKESLL